MLKFLVDETLSLESMGQLGGLSVADLLDIVTTILKLTLTPLYSREFTWSHHDLSGKLKTTKMNKFFVLRT